MRKIIITVLGLLLLTTSSVFAQDTKWKMRFRGIVVIPNESATIDVIGGDVTIETVIVPEVDFTYYFTENWAAELILATTNHDVGAVGTTAGDINLGDVWLLPPTLTLQYHVTSMEKFEPYFGAGFNYTIFYGADAGDVDDVSYTNSFGVALQFGFDYDLNDKWFLNVDLKKVFLNTDATVDATTALGATVGAAVDIDPLILGFGFGFRF